MRVRIDGMIVRLEDVDALEKQKKHSIELVDRSRRRSTPSDKGRLTDSVETALREGKGKLMVEVAGEKVPARVLGGERVPDVRHRLPRAVAAELLVQLAARHVRRVQRPRRAAWRPIPTLVVPDPTRSIRDGAVAVWGEAIAKDSGWTTNIVKALAKAFKIDLDKPWNKLSEKQRDILLTAPATSA